MNQIEIPLRTFQFGKLPSAKDVSGMVKEFRNNVTKIAPRSESLLVRRICDELDLFKVDPQAIDSYLQEPSLNKYGCGTHFILKPSSTLLEEDIDGDPSATKSASKKATPLKKALLGFSNTMVPYTSPVIDTAFRDHRTDEVVEDLIAEDEFFSPEEFVNADHRIRGKFDEFGQFNGEISIYGQTVNDHVISWVGGKGSITNCGPFSIDFAAFEGDSRHSTIPAEEHARLSSKTEQLGGLYIYRNGIRVLPYGDTDYDWLDIEFNRTKSAYYYYFSHRKMFGAVEIDAESNSNLLEKAGREGFQQNKAYRQFRSILQNFFQQMAADFFRSEGVFTDVFEDRKSELSREDAARKKRERLVSEKKKKFESDLDVFFEAVRHNRPEENALSLTGWVEDQLELAREDSNLQLAASKVLKLELQAQSRIRELEETYRVTRPQIGLSKRLQQNWSTYRSVFASLQENIFQPARRLVDSLIGDAVRTAKLSLGRHVRTQSALEDLGEEARRNTRDSSNLLRKEATKVSEEAQSLARRSLKTVESELRNVLSAVQRVDFEDMSDELFVETRDELERKIVTAAEHQSTLLSSVLEQLKSIDVTGESSSTQQLAAIEQRNILLEDEAEADAQLAQLGMAIEIISHEFSGSIRSVRNSLRKLRAWAAVNDALQDLYDSIRTSFDHLDGYLSLFTPFQRRLQRKAVEIHGHEIRTFLKELFGARLKRHNVALTATKGFVKSTLIGFPSSFYPVFVNLVDNAIFWTSQQNPQKERRIRLRERDGALLVTDTGPGVDVRDREAIFEFGFSRKPGGRGMGLHIGRESLRRIGFDLVLIDDDAGGATFAIVPNKTE